MMEQEFMDPRLLPRDHPVRMSMEAQELADIQSRTTAQMQAQSIRPEKLQGENEKNFKLHHEFLPEEIIEHISPEMLFTVNKLHALTNINETEVITAEFDFRIEMLREINYRIPRKQYSAEKSTALGALGMIFFSQIRRSRDGWEREKSVEERKVLKTEFPIAQKRKAGFLGRLFGGG